MYHFISFLAGVFLTLGIILYANARTTYLFFTRLESVAFNLLLYCFTTILISNNIKYESLKSIGVEKEQIKILIIKDSAIVEELKDSIIKSYAALVFEVFKVDIVLSGKSTEDRIKEILVSKVKLGE